MCVIVAILLPRDQTTGRPLPNARWHLAKIRDRPYVPVVEIAECSFDVDKEQPDVFRILTEGKENARTLISFRDLDTRWAEGLCFLNNGEETKSLALVNSALSNMDKYEIKLSVRAQGKRLPSKTYAHGDHILDAVKTCDIEAAVKKIKDYRLMGHTFVSDGKRLFWLEIFVPIQVTDKAEETIRLSNPGIDKVTVMQEARKLISKKDMVVNIKELSGEEDCLYVCTNHTLGAQGVGGYQSEGFSKISTISRLKYSEEFLRKFAFTKDSLITTLKTLGHPGIDPEPFFRPIRFVDKSVPVFSTMQIVFDLSEKPKMEIIPIENMVKVGFEKDNILQKWLLPSSSRTMENVIVHEPVKREKFTQVPRNQLKKSCSALLLTLMTYFLFSWFISDSSKDSIIRFWNSETPLVDGPMRLFFYPLLFIIFCTSGKGSCLSLPYILQNMDKRFMRTVGVFSWMKRDWMTVFRAKCIVCMTLLAWLFSFVGFGGQFPLVILFLGIFVLQGYDQGCRGMNHRWYIPMYTLCAMAFCDSRGTLSLDKYLADIFPNYPFPLSSAPSVLLSGFSRKFLLVAVMNTFVLGAISKLWNSNFRWTDGYTLIYCVSIKGGAWPALKTFIMKNRWAAIFLSVKTIIFEFAWILAPFFPQTVIPLVVMSASFHLGIWWTMSPNYLPQTVCYILLVDWKFVLQKLGHVSSIFEVEVFPLPPVKTLVENTQISIGMVICAYFITIFCIFLFFVTIFRIEGWPITSIPMYSLYRGVLHSRKHLLDEKQLVDEVQQYLSLGYPETISWGRGWFKVWIVNRSLVKTPVDLPFNFSAEKFKDSAFLVENYLNTHGVCAPDNQRWNSILHAYICREISQKSEKINLTANGIPENDKKTCSLPVNKSFAVQFLFLVREALHSFKKITDILPEWVHEKGEIQLVCNFLDGWVPIARVPWNSRGARAIQKSLLDAC